MRDRIPTYPGRVKLEPVAGQANTYDMTRADHPQQEGTELNKANLLTDETAGMLGLDDTATPNDAFYALALLNTAEGTTIITVEDEDGLPIPGVSITGLVNEDGAAVETGANGKATVICTVATSVSFKSPYADIPDHTETINPLSGGINLVTVVMPFYTAGTVVLFNSSQSLNFRKVRTVDLSLVGGGTGGAGALSGYFDLTGGGAGGAGGKVYNVPSALVAAGAHKLAVGAGGAGGGGGYRNYSSGDLGPKDGSAGGDTTFLDYSSASGASGTAVLGDSSIAAGGTGGKGGKGGEFYGGAGSAGSAGTKGGGNGGTGGKGSDSDSGASGTDGSAGSAGTRGGGGGGGGQGGVGTSTNKLTCGSGGKGGKGGNGCLYVRF